jgi:hypothetical protein
VAPGSWLSRLAEMELRRPWLIGLALVLQLVLGRLPSGWRGVGLATSTALVGLWLAANLPRRPPLTRAAVALLAAGWALNVAVMAPNHGMPVSRSALDSVGASDSFDVSAGNLYKHVALDDDTTLPWLGDVLALPPVGMILSPGDIVMAGGLVLLVVGTTRRGSRRTRRTPVAGGRRLHLHSSMP